MHIKFMAHGTGSGAAASAYLMGISDHKGLLGQALRCCGRPVLFGALADSLPFQQRYTSAVISWATEGHRQRMKSTPCWTTSRSWLFAGLDRQDVHLTAVLHREKMAVCMSTSDPRVHLGTGKSLNVAPPSQRSHFDSLRNKWNYGKGWARPDDPSGGGLCSPALTPTGTPTTPKQLSNRSLEYLLGLIARG